ncbi:DUF1707 and FHA domain-containing protein [Trebonia sp.]|uniref:DUF1707 and FHA domain-containing protein n=1 Tax=Trebonia sp. TaxID=2767075 RepID=UPI0026380A7F|nr:DUF1707 and FHA domain-containing protein [Trebonia sp.]
MGGTAPEAPTQPDAQPVSGVRASDAERDEVVARLTEEFAAGRLSQDTFLFRMSAVLQARHQADLPPLLADLPEAPAPSPEPGIGGAVARVPAGPAPVPVTPVPALPEPGGPPAGRPASLVSRLRSALPRRISSAAFQHGDATVRPGDAAVAGLPPGSGPARRLTGGMERAPQTRRPLPLQFPRGDGTHFSIGRDANCDLAIADMTVSRVHARLERTEDGWLLTDLASTNGTRVNGWRVRGQVRVRAGDLVSFGNAEYSLSAADGI